MIIRADRTDEMLAALRIYGAGEALVFPLYSTHMQSGHPCHYHGQKTGQRRYGVIVRAGIASCWWRADRRGSQDYDRRSVDAYPSGNMPSDALIYP